MGELLWVFVSDVLIFLFEYGMLSDWNNYLNPPGIIQKMLTMLFKVKKKTFFCDSYRVYCIKVL